MTRVVVDGRAIDVPEHFDVELVVRPSKRFEATRPVVEPVTAPPPLPLTSTPVAAELTAGIVRPATPEDRATRLQNRQANFKDLAEVVLEAKPGIHNGYTLYKQLYSCGDEETYNAVSSSAFAFHRPNEPTPSEKRTASELQAAEARAVKWRRLLSDAVDYVNRPKGRMSVETFAATQKELESAYPDVVLDQWLFAGSTLYLVKPRPPEAS